VAWRIAVTTADGVTIDQHFGHARAVTIIDVAPEGTFSVVETRPMTPWCRPGADERDAEPGTSGIAAPFPDCIALLTARIGPPARKKLELAGLSVFEEPAVIADAVKKLAAYYAKTRQPSVTAIL
jgi:predicted Fe-Mo cluster-binding NifX family protein